MAADGEGPLVAVDVMRPFQQLRGTLPKIVDTISRAMVLASSQRAESGRLLAHAVITPELGQIGTFDFGRLGEIVEAPRAAASPRSSTPSGRVQVSAGVLDSASIVQR